MWHVLMNIYIYTDPSGRVTSSAQICRSLHARNAVTKAQPVDRNALYPAHESQRAHGIHTQHPLTSYTAG